MRLRSPRERLDGRPGRGLRLSPLGLLFVDVKTLQRRKLPRPFEELAEGDEVGRTVGFDDEAVKGERGESV